MDFAKIPTGAPETPNVLIEISDGSSNKYEYDESLKALTLDFVFKDGFKFPFNYGSIPGTLAEDGDPLDAIVLSTYPILPGTIVVVKPIGILNLKDRGEQDNKLITVLNSDPLTATLNSIVDLTLEERNKISNFFKEVGVQKNKTMDIEGFYDKDAAIEEIKKCQL